MRFDASSLINGVRSNSNNEHGILSDAVKNEVVPDEIEGLIVE
jgi:hypothetical protein